jgi:hypothetical protein
LQSGRYTRIGAWNIFGAGFSRVALSGVGFA